MRKFQFFAFFLRKKKEIGGIPIIYIIERVSFMAMISNEEINDIRAKANIVDIFALYNIKLEKKGKNYACCCPFHNEKTPSMIVSESKQIFKWWKCI